MHNYFRDSAFKRAKISRKRAACHECFHAGDKISLGWSLHELEWNINLAEKKSLEAHILF